MDGWLDALCRIALDTLPISIVRDNSRLSVWNVLVNDGTDGF